MIMFNPDAKLINSTNVKDADLDLNNIQEYEPKQGEAHQRLVRNWDKTKQRGEDRGDASSRTDVFLKQSEDYVNNKDNLKPKGSFKNLTKRNPLESDGTSLGK